MGYDFTPMRGGQPVHVDVKYELEEYPEDKTEKDLERHVAPAIRGHMKDWLAAIASRGRPVADIEEGHISTASCILANLALKTGPDPHLGPAGAQDRRRRRGQPLAPPAVSQPLDPPGAGELTPARRRPRAERSRLASLWGAPSGAGGMGAGCTAGLSLNRPCPPSLPDSWRRANLMSLWHVGFV